MRRQSCPTNRSSRGPKGLPRLKLRRSLGGNRRRSTAAPSGKTVRVGGELSLKDLAGQAGLLLVGAAGDGRPQEGPQGQRRRRADQGTRPADTPPRRRPRANPVRPRRREGRDGLLRDSRLRWSRSERRSCWDGSTRGCRSPRRGGSKSLDSRRQEETLTPEEHAELLILIDESERLAVGRAEALVELARLRGSTVPSLMCDLGLGFTGRG